MKSGNSVPGAAEFLRGGVVAYQESVKRGLLGVVAESVLLLNCARQMASGVCELLGADGDRSDDWRCG